MIKDFYKYLLLLENNEKIDQIVEPILTNNNDYVKILRLAKRLAFIKIFGDKCERCGERDFFLLSFHHNDRKEKLFNPSKLWGMRIENIKSELIGSENFSGEHRDKFKSKLLCYNCHAKTEFEQANNTEAKHNLNKSKILDFYFRNIDRNKNGIWRCQSGIHDYGGQKCHNQTKLYSSMYDFHHFYPIVNHYNDMDIELTREYDIELIPNSDLPKKNFNISAFLISPSRFQSKEIFKNKETNEPVSKLLEELENCNVFCKNCHSKFHNDLRQDYVFYEKYKSIILEKVDKHIKDLDSKKWNYLDIIREIKQDWFEMLKCSNFYKDCDCEFNYNPNWDEKNSDSFDLNNFIEKKLKNEYKIKDLSTFTEYYKQAFSNIVLEYNFIRDIDKKKMLKNILCQGIIDAVTENLIDDDDCYDVVKYNQYLLRPDEVLKSMLFLDIDDNPSKEKMFSFMNIHKYYLFGTYDNYSRYLDPDKFNRKLMRREEIRKKKIIINRYKKIRNKIRRFSSVV